MLGRHLFAYNMLQIGLSPGTTRTYLAPYDHATPASSERDSIALRTAVVLLALLHPDGDEYRLEARAESGAVVVVRYDAQTGLS
jgi:hypothetical protein